MLYPVYGLCLVKRENLMGKFFPMVHLSIKEADKLESVRCTCSCVRLNSFRSCLFLSVSCWLSYGAGKFCGSCPGGARACNNRHNKFV